MIKRVRTIMLISILLTLTACAKSVENRWQEQYDLGIRYLSDGNYEEAVIAFTAAIEIDPKNADAYLNLAEAYMDLEKYDYAIEVLENGIRQTKDKSLKNMLDQISIKNNENIYLQQKVFSLEVLEEWGFPFGMEYEDLSKKIEISEQKYNEILKEHKMGHGGCLRISKNPEIYIDTEHMKIGMVMITGDMEIQGPNGIHIGMEFSDVINSFYCDEEKMYDIENMKESELETLISEKGLILYDTNFLYNNYQIFSIGRPYLDINGCLAIGYEFDVFKNIHESAEICRLNIMFDEYKKVREICVSYQYND